MWNWWICDLQTGQRLYRVIPADGNWNISASQPGGGAHSFILHGPVLPGLSKAQWQDIAHSWTRVLVQSWNDEDPIYAGLLIAWEWDEDAARLILNHVELRALFSRRFTWGHRGYDVGSPLEFADRAPAGALRAIVERATNDGAPDDHPWRLRVARPADAAGDMSMTWPNDTFQTIEDALVSLEDAGTHIWFRPRWDDDHRLEHLALIGTPLIAGETVDIVATSPSPIARKLRVKSDGAGQLTGVFAIGNGSGESMKVGFAGTFENFTTPILDRTIFGKSDESGGQLEAMAAVDLETHRDPIEQRTFSVLASLLPVPPGRLTIGGRIHLGWFGHVFIDDGWSELYIIAIAGGLDEELALTTQEVA
ncbi:hypothetical protein GRS96_12335 [Rathayibacter sp. VKM Ac-2803]|uniref:hypothetical protein n=1 Tax=Rathayibacter sp. VKM Ac-2803 TaxID=2609256 RepID=UPI00135CAF76|nr:hypothetical protein [Rathayibacter sp. VKM Ac-2803]MWV50057.1 hypothetical protein [Rathayibacter sp. VKM Ac-2803]